jgi:hypothetical protein
MNYEKPRNMKEECPKRKGNASNIYKLMWDYKYKSK